MLDEDELAGAAGDGLALLPDDEEAGAGAVEGDDGAVGALVGDSDFVWFVDAEEGFEASPDGGFILSE